MKRNLIRFSIKEVIGVGIYVLTGFETKNEAGPTVVIAYMVSRIFAMLFDIFLLLFSKGGGWRGNETEGLGFEVLMGVLWGFERDLT